MQDLLSRAWERHLGPGGARIEVVVLGTEEHTRIHAEFLDDPAETDVMAFPYQDPDLFGEILLNRDVCRRDAERHGRSVRDEARLYVVHGALHLLGFRDDESTARQRMRAAEAELLGEDPGVDAPAADNSS